MLPTRALVATATLFSLFLMGCEDVSQTGPSDKGPYTMCRYTEDLESDGHWSARISYPCETQNGPFPAITVTGGFTNVKEQMYWLTNHLTEHGFIVNTMTPNNPISFPPTFAKAHKSGFQQLIDENSRSDSPVKGLIQTDNIGMLGYSYGGAGALLAADELGDQIASVVALAPVFASQVELEGVDAPNLVLGGVNDTILGPAEAMELIYNAIDPSLSSLLVVLNDVGHLDFIEPGNYHNLMKNYVVSFFKLQQESNPIYMSYLNGSKHQEFVQDGRIYLYDDDL
jgi:predicted dienelactone hydrolase